MVFVAGLAMHVTEHPSLSCDSSPNPAVPAGPRCTILPHPGCPWGINKGGMERVGLPCVPSASRCCLGGGGMSQEDLGCREWVLQDCAFGVL